MSDFATALKNAINHWDQQQKEEPMQTTATVENTQATPTPTPPRKIARVVMPDGRSVFAPTNNVSRETFEFIKANPGLTTAQISQALVARGFNGSSVTSLVSQMVRVKMVHKDAERRIFAQRARYKPIDSNSATLKKPQAKASVASKRAVEAPSKDVKEVSVRALEIRSDMNETQFVDAILTHVSVFGARVLYDKLKPLFDK